MSNNKQVLASIPEEERRKGVLDQDLEFGMLPTEKALGVYWNTEEDNIGFEVRLKDKPNTKRGMLSVVSSIYDPLGLVSPFILEGRQIVQKLCFGKLNWDEPVNEDVKQHWQNWMCKLKSLKNIKLNRCYKSAGFGKVLSYSLHYFLDASCNCQSLINAPGYIRGTLLFLLTKNNPVTVFCYCIFVILLLIIGNDVISDAINMVTLITIRKHYDT